MGMRERQILTRTEIPLALPVIMAGLRLAAVTIVATATLGAIFGYGGLGRYLVDGIAQNDDGQLFGGVVLAAGLTLLTEALFALLQRFGRVAGPADGSRTTLRADVTAPEPAPEPCLIVIRRGVTSKQYLTRVCHGSGV